MLQIFKLKSIRSVLVIVISSCCFNAIGATDVVTNKKSNAKSNYMTGLLELALSYSDKTYRLTDTDELLSKSRVLESMKNGSVHVTWGGTSEKMESDYIPVRIDTYRGLMSHRILLIRSGDQAKFSQIKTAADLQTIKFGQGRRWQDTKILEAAGLKVIKSNKKNNLYFMLDGDRFDAFPRGASEAIVEVNNHPELPLAIEQDLVIIYPLPTYFFVSKHYPALAKDLEFGMEAILADGKFDEYFYGSPEIQATLEGVKLSQRRAIRLENPYLPKATPLHRKELWLNLTSN
ncbi:diguanylate cyclase [Catenovulum sp. SX2]|uniref:diguanylate cyclase n=1 Tax=Catenovulum sp. SX2 TaxID=3398614 RepID=UPI003F869AC3